MHIQFGGFCGWKRIKGRRNHVRKKNPSDDVARGGWGRCRKERISQRRVCVCLCKRRLENGKKTFKQNWMKEKKAKETKASRK